MTRTLFIAATILASSACALAQEPPALAPAPPGAAALEPQAQPPQTPPGSAQSQISRERLQKIYLIRQLEGILTTAVRTGATSVANQLKVADPTSLFVTGSARARGFELDGYGVVFDVDVPTMMQSMLWSTQTLQRQQEINQLNATINDPRATDGVRQYARGELRRLQRMMNPQGAPIPDVAPASPGAPPPGIAVAQIDVSDAKTLSPDEMYTEVIKSALIDTMLTFGPTLHLGDDEWLTVAARATAQAIPNQLDDSSSIVIRIKGADLTAFLTGKLTKDEVMKRVGIKEG